MRNMDANLPPDGRGEALAPRGQRAVAGSIVLIHNVKDQPTDA
jgi:hypothetical protein